MSAFMCSDLHISAIVDFCRSPTTRIGSDVMQLSPQELGDKLYAANVMSVNHRYNQNDPVTGFVYKANPANLRPVVEILKMLDCLEYQSCEYPGFIERDGGFWLIHRIRKAAIKKLVGYDDAPWDVN